MKKGNLVSVTKPIAPMGGASKSGGNLGGLMGDADAAGVAVKQTEGVSVGSPSLTTPSTSIGGSKSQSSYGAKVGKADVVSPSK